LRSEITSADGRASESAVRYHEIAEAAPPAPITKAAAPVSDQCPSGTNARSARPLVIGSLAWPHNPFALFERQLTSPSARACASSSAKRSRQDSSRSILCVVTSAPTESGSSVRNETNRR